MKDILVLGKGYVGNQLVSYLQEKNIKVISFKKSELNYTSPSVLQEYLSKNAGRFEFVVNCSGYTGIPNVDACELNKEDCWFWNVIVPHNIAVSSNIFNLPVINISSGCIYSGYEKEYTEEDVPDFGLFSLDSSYYSKCKHACETLLKNFLVYTFRVRLPFDGTKNRKNYLNKILYYDNLISYKNSMTSINDLNDFLFKFLFIYKHILPGPINVVNRGAADAKEVVYILKKYNLINPNWNFVELKDIKIKANRSNCVLATNKIKSVNLELPNVFDSLERDIKLLSQQ